MVEDVKSINQDNKWKSDFSFPIFKTFIGIVKETNKTVWGTGTFDAAKLSGVQHMSDIF